MFYTDYPIVELGDKHGEQAPIRRITIIQFEGDKYVDIIVEGITTSIKFGYIYRQEKLPGKVPSFCAATIEDIIWEGLRPGKE